MQLGGMPLRRAAIAELERHARLQKKKKGKEKDKPRKEARIRERQQALLQAQAQAQGGEQGLAATAAELAPAPAPRPQAEEQFPSPLNEVQCAHCPLLSVKPEACRPCQPTSTGRTFNRMFISQLHPFIGISWPLGS